MTIAFPAPPAAATPQAGPVLAVLARRHRPERLRRWRARLPALLAAAALAASAGQAMAQGAANATSPATTTPAASPAPGSALADLQAFLQRTQQGRASFTQTVTGPRPAAAPDALPARPGGAATAGSAAAGAAGPARVQVSSGVFEFQRPDRFRFQYQRPFEQTVLADGQTLWLHDPDLNQVTARPQRQALGETPAALLAAAPDLRALQQVFELRNAPDADGLRWVEALPRNPDAPLQAVRVGFRAGQLAQFEILDRFGQRSQLVFERFDPAPGFRAGHFSFSVPPGATVIRPQ